jgi:uncharacterized protein (TIGR02145 family)
MKREIWIGTLILKYFSIVITFVALFFSCTKDDSNPVPPSPLETVTDIDGNVYRTVVIGTQVWMAENLKVVHYLNGEAIANVTEDTTWANLSTGAWCSYDNDAGKVSTYGLLYNWYAVDDSSNIAPAGWHVPSDEEWHTLVDYLGGVLVAGGKMKTTGTIEEGDGLWHINYQDTTDATNESGFSALPGGQRHNNGLFTSIGNGAPFWSSTEHSTGSALYLGVGYLNSSAFRSRADTRYGLSVRCVKD